MATTCSTRSPLADPGAALGAHRPTARRRPSLDRHRCRLRWTGESRPPRRTDRHRVARPIRRATDRRCRPALDGRGDPGERRAAGDRGDPRRDRRRRPAPPPSIEGCPGRRHVVAPRPAGATEAREALDGRIGRHVRRRACRHDVRRGRPRRRRRPTPMTTRQPRAGNPGAARPSRRATRTGAVGAPRNANDERPVSATARPRC